ncbi:MAG: RCC1 domain-containing protein [Lentisphaeria bacterium]
MQILPGIIKIENGKGKWCDITGTPGEVPRITLALAAQLVIDLRSNRLAAPQTADLAPYPFAEVGNCSAFYIAVDSDYNQLTIPPIIRTSGITASQDADGSTILAAALPLLDSPELRNAVKTSTEVLLKAELGGLDATGQTVFVVQFPLVLQNRVYIPDGSGGETPDPADPDYLTTPQIKAYINDELAAAIAALKLPVGETGPAPIITIGTVEEGEDAAAAIVPVGEGAYAINLTLPRATDGETPEPITPQIAIGTIQSGDAAAATLTPVIGTPGAFTLNLTLPRGADGAGVTPRGPWAAGTTYNQNDAIRHASAWWRSLHDDNVGHEPPANRVDNAHWEVIVKDGLSADPLVVSYNDTDNPDDADWHLDRRATDKYYRWTTDGGLTFTEAALLTQAAIEPIIRFNPDATTDWQNIPAPVGTNNYHTVTGKYYRLKTDSGVWGESKQVHNLDASEVYRVQFGATPDPATDPATGEPIEPAWHANFLPGDNRIIFYNLAGTIRLDVTVNLPDGEEIGGVQFCPISDPWHATYATGDRYRKFSMDGGLTYGLPIPLYGKSAYEEWLDLGNSGTPEDFLASLKGEPGNGEGGTTTPLSSSNPLGLGLASAGVATSAARADHVHPVTGLVLASEKGAVLGVASLGLDGKVPLSQLPAMSGGTALPIFHQRFARPYFEAATHLVVQAAHELDFSDAVTIIDTANVVADRAKVIAYNGAVLMACPETGFGGNFSGQPVRVDLSAITETCILRYKWVSAAGDSDWYVTFFPSNGEAYVAPPASSSGETPAPTTFGTLKVNISGAMTGQWSADGGSTWHDSGDTITVATGTHTVTFAYVDGYTTPVYQAVTVSAGELSTVTAEYAAIPEPTETQGVLIVTITGSSEGRWSVDGGSNWNVSGAGLLLTAGDYTITFKAVNGYATPGNDSVTITAEQTETASAEYVVDTSGLFACGYNYYGQLGLDDAEERNILTRVGSAANWVSVAAGNEYSLAINTSGELYAWGNNSYGQLGLGDTTSRNTPTRVGSATNWVKVAAGYFCSFAINTSGELYAWGRNDAGNLGLGHTSNRYTPVRVGSAANWVSVACRHGTLAINTSGELYAWGNNSSGQLGLGDTTSRNTPTRVGSATNWVKVAAGHFCSFAINTSGELYAWGNNSYGQLGLGDTTSRNTPTRVGSATNWISVAGYIHTLAINSSGELYACGENQYGGLGLGDTIARNTLTQVGSATNWVSVAAGYYYSLAINSSGELFAWGVNTYGKLGLGDTTYRYEPTQVGNATGWKSTAAGNSHTLAIFEAAV